MESFDSIIIGGGISGACIFSKLVRSGVKCALIEIGDDISLGATKANSGIVHAGYDCAENTAKAKYNVWGNQIFKAQQIRLGEEFVQTGSLVVCEEEGLPKLQELLLRGKHNGVKNLKILNRNALLKLEPNLKENIAYGLYAKSAAIISPYNTAISLCEEAIINGGKLFLNFNTVSIKKEKNAFIVSDGKTNLMATFVINCAGAGVNDINKLIGEPEIDVTFTKGEYLILDKSERGLVSRPIFPLPTKLGKGILAVPAPCGNTILGPTAVDIPCFETSVSQEGINYIKKSTSGMLNGINFKKAIKMYAGVRVKTGDDFIVKFSNNIENYYLVAGMASPGLTAAPAVAEQVLSDLLAKGLKTKKITVKKRVPYTNISKMSEKSLNALIKKDKNYGKIVCRCEGITLGEILEVLKGPIKNLSIDAIKRRLRPTMGRCQGSFCLPHLISIISKEYKISPSEVVFKNNVPLLSGDIKEGGIYEV